MPLITSRGLGLKLAIASAVVLVTVGDLARCDDGPASSLGSTTWDSSCCSVTWLGSSSAPAALWGESNSRCICLTKWLVYRENRVDETMGDESKRSIGGTAFVRWQVEGRKDQES